MMTRIDLHEALGTQSFDHALILTYRFDPVFFEEYCLQKFNSLSSNGNITVITDRRTYQESILGPATDRPKQANLRYLFHPVSPPGIFHPKLYLFAGRKMGRLLIGSANLTRPGICSNAEMMGCYDYAAEKNVGHRELFKSALSFAFKITEKWPCEALSSNLDDLVREVPWLSADQEGTQDTQIELINNLETPLCDQIISKVNPPVDAIYFLSRYFDSSPEILDRIYHSFKPRKISIFTQNGTTNLHKDWLKHSLVTRKLANIFLCEYRDGLYPQKLHAKALIIKKGKETYLFFGSANFTTPALLRTVENGNLEVLVALRNLEIKPYRSLTPKRVHSI